MFTVNMFQNMNCVCLCWKSAFRRGQYQRESKATGVIAWIWPQFILLTKCFAGCFFYQFFFLSEKIPLMLSFRCSTISMRCWRNLYRFLFFQLMCTKCPDGFECVWHFCVQSIVFEINLVLIFKYSFKGNMFNE